MAKQMMRVVPTHVGKNCAIKTYTNKNNRALFSKGGGEIQWRTVDATCVVSQWCSDVDTVSKWALDATVLSASGTKNAIFALVTGGWTLCCQPA